MFLGIYYKHVKIYKYQDKLKIFKRRTHYMSTTATGTGKNNIVEGLMRTTAPLNVTGVMYKTTGTNLGSAIIDMLDSLGIVGIQDCYFMPTWNGRDGSTGTRLANIECAILFNIGVAGENNSICFNRPQAGRSNGNVRMITDYMPNIISSGSNRTSKYKFSQTFSDVFGKLTNGNIEVKNPMSTAGSPIKNMGCVAVDTFKIIALALGIKESEPYDFTIVDGYSIENGDDFVMLIEKYIDGGKSNRSRNIDMRSMFKRR